MKRVLLIIAAVLLMGATSPPVNVPITITAAGTINATTYCAANGGGDGSSGSPWQDQCIVAAVNAASPGNTVFLAAGNWALNTSVATFTGTISGSTLTVSGVTGTVAIGQAINGANVIGSATGTNFFLPVTITASCGANCWTLSNSLSTGVSGAMTSGYPVVVQNSNIHIVGAGSGNTFDAYGHPRNGFTASLSGFYATITPSGSITRVYTTGPTYTRTGAGGFVTLNGHSGGTGLTISNVFLDGSQGYNGGISTGTLFLVYCNNCVIDNVRSWASGPPRLGESQFSINNSNNVTVKNSVIAEPPMITAPFYTNAQVSQHQWDEDMLMDNNLFYQGDNNPISLDRLTFQRTAQYNLSDALGLSQYNPVSDATGCVPVSSCPPSGSTTGSYGFYALNNYFYSFQSFGAGGGVDDPGGSGQLNDISFIGNWAVGNTGTAEVGGCAIAAFGGGFCASGVGAPNGSGMQINCASAPCNQQFAIRNNSLIATGAGSAAVLNATGTGIGYAFGVYGSAFTGSIDNGTAGVAGNTLHVSAVSSGSLQSGQYFGGTGVTPNSQITGGLGSTWTIGGSPQNVASEGMVSGYNNTVYGFNATQNYLSSPNNQYLTDANGISPAQSNNFCNTSSFSGCNTSGFTTPPTCSFTLGTLSGSIVPFASTTYTAQYGAVQWLASTSATTPTSADARWNNDNDHGIGDVSGGNSYLPPVSLTPVSHGNTVYAWVMDSASPSHISSCGSVAVP